MTALIYLTVVLLSGSSVALFLLPAQQFSPVFDITYTAIAALVQAACILFLPPFLSRQNSSDQSPFK